MDARHAAWLGTPAAICDAAVSAALACLDSRVLMRVAAEAVLIGRPEPGASDSAFLLRAAPGVASEAGLSWLMGGCLLACMR